MFNILAISSPSWDILPRNTLLWSIIKVVRIMLVSSVFHTEASTTNTLMLKKSQFTIILQRAEDILLIWK